MNRLIWSGLFVCVLTTCVRADESQRLRELFHREWEWTMEQWPDWASSLGDRRWNDRWPDVSAEATERRVAHERDLLKELDGFDRSKLPALDALNLSLFRRRLEDRLAGHELKCDLTPLDQRGGIQTADGIVDSARFQTLKDYEDYVHRLQTLGTYVRQTMGIMQRGIDAHVMLPKICLQRIPAQIDKQIVGDPTTSRFYEPFKRMPASIEPAARERLAAEGRKAIADQVVHPYREFKAFFVERYLPAGYDDVGVWQAPRGDEMYALFVREHTTTDLTPEQIHQIGLQEVERIGREMERVKASTGFKGSMAEFFEFLRTDKRFFYPNGDELLAGARAVAKRIDTKLMKLFRTLPRQTYGVEPIPMNVAPDTTAAYYEPGAADGSRAGCFRVNLYKPETRPKWELPALTLHEAVPGHHLQIARAMELGELPEFRRYGEYTAFVEGWALYAERLGEEIGMYDDPYDRFGELTYEMWRAVRLVVDTGIHAKHWSRQRAIDYFKANAPRAELDIVNEVDRYIAWPGQALAYKIGERKIRELRARAENALGGRFDVRDFNDTVIGSGAVPLDELERIVDRWITASAETKK